MTQHSGKGGGGGEQVGTALASGSYTLSSRAYTVSVPTGSGPFPVLIALHGNGGSGSGAVRLAENLGSDVTDRFIIVGPDGPQKSWNIVAESSTEDDVGYVGTTLLQHLASASNTNGNFALLGNSNGAALINRILIENDNSQIVAAITDVSQLNAEQYKSDNFMIGGSTNEYNTPKNTLTKRTLLQLTGALDDIVPAAGGPSKIPGKDGAKLSFIPWAESAYHYAKAYGYTGSQASTESGGVGDDTYSKVSYSMIGVEAYNFNNAGHAVVGTSATAKAAAVALLNTVSEMSGSAGSAVTSTSGSAGSASTSVEGSAGGAVGFASGSLSASTSSLAGGRTSIVGFRCMTGTFAASGVKVLRLLLSYLRLKSVAL
eukprot:CAMPEP_0169152564 /NCGR_PEP_ID=MMETSP1015-20121227/51577_1 /TAXON_ID=342587 /ORGANISM="Karlodinium micrum, Strain CCMP2283" /LENGTH=372 /DNA_ID=CAMNT_0009222359 /DNA_START=149 /DNA_END=1264 /DNA_ORIENTATION=+